jgi:TolA-binding protein
MKKRILLLLSLIFSVAAVTFAQTKTVTNADLESFRQKRLQAEKDYRENYAKLGFPSPQELEKQLAEDQRRLEELSTRLRAERLERERIEAQNDILETQNKYRQTQENYPQYERNYFSYIPFGYYALPNYRRNYYNRRKSWRNNQSPVIRPPKPIRQPRWLQIPNR